MLKDDASIFGMASTKKVSTYRRYKSRLFIIYLQSTYITPSYLTQTTTIAKLKLKNNKGKYIFKVGIRLTSDLSETE